jgi:hypothetical protein
LAGLRLSYWHRRILPGDPLEPYGLLLLVRPSAAAGAAVYDAALAGEAFPASALSIDLGGRRILSLTRQRKCSYDDRAGG